MEEIVKMLSSYGVSFVIVALFLWDYIVNRKRDAQNQEIMKDSLNAVKESTSAISKCMEEIKQSNDNISKSLDIVQQNVNKQSDKLDKLLDLKK